MVSGDVFMEAVGDGRARKTCRTIVCLYLKQLMAYFYHQNLTCRIFYEYLLRFQLLSAFN